MRLITLEGEFEELLDKTIAEEEAGANLDDVTETLQDLKAKMEAQYNAKREMQQKEIEELRHELERKNDDVHKLNTSLTELKRANEDLQAKVSKLENIIANRSGSGGNQSSADKDNEMERIRRKMAQQLADFEVMKKSLMRDLQQRCEKVSAYARQASIAGEHVSM
jgi:kinesin family protein 5